MNNEVFSTSFWDKLAMLCLANLLSFYCFYLSGILYIDSSSLFFSSQFADLSNVSSLLSFFLGFLLRPLGAIFFGFYGDTQGLKKWLVIGLVVLGMTTVMLGLVPPFEDIGVVSSFIYVILRLGQGFALGGTYACSAVLAYEISPSGRKGRYTSLVQLSVPTGYLAALAVIIILKLVVGMDSFLAWGWRLSFLFGGATLWLARSLWKREIQAGESQREQGLSAFKTELRLFLKDESKLKKYTLFILPAVVGLGIIGYVSNIYKLYFMQSILKIDPDTSVFIVAMSSVLYMPTYIIWGILADKGYQEKLALGGLALTLIFMYPLYMLMEWWVRIHQDAAGRISGHTWFLILSSALISEIAIVPYVPLIVFVCSRVPKGLRCTLFAISYNLGFGIFAGLLHLLTGYFYVRYKWIFSGLIFMEIMGAIGLVVALWNRPKKIS